MLRFVEWHRILTSWDFFIPTTSLQASDSVWFLILTVVFMMPSQCISRVEWILLPPQRLYQPPLLLIVRPHKRKTQQEVWQSFAGIPPHILFVKQSKLLLTPHSLAIRLDIARLVILQRTNILNYIKAARGFWTDIKHSWYCLGFPNYYDMMPVSNSYLLKSPH